MSNKNKLKVLIAILFFFIIILAGMLIYVINEKMNETASTTATNAASQTTSSTEPQTSVVNETIDLKVFYYDADDYDNPKEIRIVTVDKKLYQDDITSAINKVLESTGLKINKATVNENSIVIDLPKDISIKFNEGSAGGITRTNILAMTILNLPGIEKMEVTVDGVAGVAGDHFNFNGTFSKADNGEKYTFTISK